MQVHPVRSHQLKLRHMISKGSCHVMILAVDVIGDGPTQRHVLRPWSDR